MYDLMGIGMVKEYIRGNMRVKKEVKVSNKKVLYGSYCSKGKRDRGDFDWDKGFKKYKIGDLYIGNRWDYIRDYIKNRGINWEDCWVFSGKYSMVNWNIIVEWYDVYMNKDRLNEEKERVKEWCKGMIDRYGEFKLVWFYDNSIYNKSKHYMDVMEVIRELGCELELINVGFEEELYNV